MFKLNNINKDDILINQFVTISSDTLRNHFTKDYYRKFLFQLIDNKIIERSPYCNLKAKKLYKGPDTNENRPFGYRINQKLLDFSNIVFVTTDDSKKISSKKQYKKVIKDLKLLDFDIEGMLSDINSFNINNNIKVNQQITNPELEVIYIRKPLPNPIKMQLTKALLQAKRYGVDVIQYKSYTYICDKNYFIRTRTIQFKTSQIYTITKLLNKDFYASVNTTNFRLDTNLTNLNSVFFDNGRVTLNKEKLVDIDLKNSQPTLLAYLLLDLNMVKQKFPTINSYRFPDMDVTKPDVINFCTYAGEGKIYDYLSSVTGWTRTESKLAFIKIMFSKPGWNSTKKSVVKSLFPTIIYWMDEFKKINGDHESLAIMLQRIESEIFIKNIYKLVRKEHIVYTKHDSILCKASERDTIKNKMENILDEYGFKYKLE